MKRLFSLLFVMLMATSGVVAKDKTVRLRFVETSDVHGSFMPYDFINRKQKNGSLAQVSFYVNELRRSYGENLILLENGDLLQGQPIAYYYNYIATDEENLAASITNFMKYDVQNFGNHDVETGHAVYDKWIKETKATTLGANIIDTSTDKPYVAPYKVLYRDGVKIVILGMVTSAIPSWLGENLWSGLRFENIVESTRKWVDYIKKNEKPDVLVGLFHSGHHGGIVDGRYHENAMDVVSRQIPGFDVIFFGHDHSKMAKEIVNDEGGKVWLLDPANGATHVGDAEISITIREDKHGNRKVTDKKVTGSLANVSFLPADEAFVNTFAKQVEDVNSYINEPIGECTEAMTTKDCFFGPSTFTDLIQNMQLALSGAQISFTAPLAFNAEIKKGTLHVSDMFNLYKFENHYCVLRMTGKEILGHLQMSYDNWVNTMTSADDHIMQLQEREYNGKKSMGFKNQTFNFDSAAGIDYEVDVTKPAGEKVKILRMSNGEPFNPDATYLVVMNSYRANGGGELLTNGAGIPKEELTRRVVFDSEKDLRFYLTEKIKKDGGISPKINDNWRFVPEEWTAPALARDRKLIFGK